MACSSTLLRWVMWGTGSLLALRPLSSLAQTDLKVGDVVITGVNATNPDVFDFVPLVDLTAGMQLKFTDNGWYHNGGFRNNEGVATYTVPAGGLARGTKVIYSADPSVCAPGFTTTGQFALGDDGDQLLVYQGTAAAPRFIYGLSLRKGWTDARSDNTSALPAELTDGMSAVSLSWANAYQKHGGQHKGGTNKLRSRFTKRNNWTGSNTTATTWYSQPAYTANLIVEKGIASRQANKPLTAGQGLSQVRTLTYTDTNLSNPVTGEFALDQLCSQPTGVRRVILRIKFSANSLVDPGNGQPSVELHNMGDADFNGYVHVELNTDYSGIGPVDLQIDKKTPEQTYVLDLTDYFANFVLTGAATRLWVDTPAYSFDTPDLASNARMSVTLEESYYQAPEQVVLCRLCTSDAGDEMQWGDVGGRLIIEKRWLGGGWGEG